jgi:hypothetical protein
MINASKEIRKTVNLADRILNNPQEYGEAPTDLEIKEIINSLKTIINDSNLLKSDRLNSTKKLIDVGNYLGGDYQDISIKIITTSFCVCVESNDGTDADTARTLKKRLNELKDIHNDSPYKLKIMTDKIDEFISVSSGNRKDILNGMKKDLLPGTQPEASPTYMQKIAKKYPMTSTTAMGFGAMLALGNGIASLSDGDLDNNQSGTALAVVGVGFLAETIRQVYNALVSSPTKN